MAALILLGLLTTGVASAITFEDLYTVEVEPNPELAGAASEAARRTDAARRAMAILLTRITGRRDAAGYPELRELIDNAVSYLERYAPSADRVRVEFLRPQVNDVLTRQNMPIWGDERPATLLWLVADLGDGQTAELVASDDPTALQVGNVSGDSSLPLVGEAAETFDRIADLVLTAAYERGLPIVLPRLDTEDRQDLQFLGPGGGFEPNLSLAAQRYQADAVLLARIAATEFGLEAEWTLERGGRRVSLSTVRAREGIDWLADELASEYTTVGGAQFTWITIQGVERWEDYRVLDVLESISIIEQLDVESFGNGTIVLRVAARGDDRQLERLVTLGGELVAVPGAPGLTFRPASGQPVELRAIP